jgi:uncharacterized protein YceK
MKKLSFLSLVLATCLLLAGCGNVTITGDAATALDNSALDAFNANTRAAADPAIPWWAKAYMEENYIQWRWFDRSARKDLSWGPKLPGEPGYQPPSTQPAAQ